MSRQAIFPEGIEPGITIGQLPEIIANIFPDQEAVVTDIVRKTWAEYSQDVNKLSIGLIKLGIKKRDHVSVWAKNVYEWMIAWWAIAKIGGRLIPLDHWYKKADANYILKHSGAKAIITASDYVPLIQDMDNLENLSQILMIKEGELDKIDFSDKRIQDLKELMNNEIQDSDIAKLRDRVSSIDPEEVFLILYTSGTTGQPKGAMLTHNNILLNNIEIAKALVTDQNDIFLVPVPFSHCFGCELAMTTATLTGAKCVPLIDQNPSLALKMIVKERCSVVHGTPTHFIRYLKEYEAHPEYDITCLRSGIIAGAPVPVPVITDIMQKMHLTDISNGYGLTEASPIITITNPNDPLEKRMTTVGRKIRDIEVRIVDENNQELPIGEAGELVVRGWNVMKGYYNDPEMTSRAIDRNGWLHTGDLATVDSEGYYKITGRIKDMIIYGGANVYPKIVEDFLLKNPKIYEVAVVGIKDDEYGELVACVAVVEEGFTEQDLVDFCYGKLNDFSVPRFVKFDVPIPLSGRGKIQKYKLRETLEQLKKDGKLGKKIVPTKIKLRKQQKIMKSIENHTENVKSDLNRKVNFVPGVHVGITVGELIDIVALQYPEKEAIVIDGIRKNWQEFHIDVNKFCMSLIKLGFHKGNTIGIWSQNNYEWIVSWFACAKLGLLIVPLDHWYKIEEANYIINHSENKGVICTADYIDTFAQMKEIRSLEHIIIMDAPSSDLKEKDEKTTYRIHSMKNMMSPELTTKDLELIKEKMNFCDADDVCFILYTSGTTGQPKGAMLTHNNIIHDLMEIATALRADENDTYLIPVVFSHCFGNELGITMATLTGSKMVPLKDQTPSIALKAIITERCTIVHGTPTHFIRYIREIEKHPEYDISCLRTGVTAGAPCSPKTMNEIMTKFHMPDIVNAYGETEVSPIMTLTRVTDTMDKRLHTVGSLFEGVEGKIVDDENNDLPTGEAGEICCRGWNVMKGYYKEPQLTSQTIDEEGWLHTGDLGIIDEEGYFRIVGRKKDMIIYGGANVYPKIIENFLLKHPKILECAIVGVPNEEYGELVACVAKTLPDFTEQELVDYCYGAINDFSVPRYVRFDIPLPLSGRGKVQKFKLRDTLKKLLLEAKLGDRIIPTKIKERKTQKNAK